MKSFVFVALFWFLSVGMVLGCVLHYDDHNSDEMGNVENLDDLDDYDSANNDTAYSDEADYDLRDYPTDNYWIPPEFIRDAEFADMKNPMLVDEKETWQAPSHEEAKHTKTEDKKDPSPKTEPVPIDKMIIEKSNDGNATIKVPLKK